MPLYLSGDPLAPTDPDSPMEAVRWFRARAPVPRDVWEAQAERSHRRAFTLAGATALDMVEQVWRAADRAIATGSNFTDFKRDVGGALRDAWAGTDPARLDLIFRNAVQTAYGAGRYREQTEPDVLIARPYWRFDAILDSRTSPICQPLDGLVRPAGDAFWATHYPPLHHRCRSGVTTLTREQAAEHGGPGVVPTDVHPPGPGWGGAPTASEWEPAQADYPPELWAAYRRFIDGS